MAKLLQVYEHEGLTVTYNTRRCIHAAECVRHLPAVFDPGARPWVRPERATADDVITAVLRCPTGALQAQRDGATITSVGERDADTASVRVTRHGPLYARGEVTLVAEDGTEIVSDTRLALCRCGHSRRKPLCDGSHRTHQFRDPETTTP